MERQPTRCECLLADCAWYNAVPGEAGKCDCTHQDKAFYLRNPCPLYRKDWKSKDTDKMKDITAKIRGKRAI